MTSTARITPQTRRQLVAECAVHGQTEPRTIAGVLADRGVINARTGKPYSVATVRQDVAILRATGVDRSVVKEIIGRNLVTSPLWAYRSKNSVDGTITDYEFWDKLRRGKAEGFKFGGLFCQPLTQIIASFVMGSGIQAKLVSDMDDTNREGDTDASESNVEYTNNLLGRFMSRSHALFVRMTEDLYALGDQYIAVNPDGSLSVPSPELVDVEADEQDYRRETKVTVTAKLPKWIIKDEYTETGRTVTATPQGSTANVRRDEQVIQYENLIGRLPIVHWANDRGTNELFGRPIYEALYRLFSRYDDLIEKAIDGAELMGNPIPTFEGMENIDETIDANATIDDEEYTDAEGNEETRKLIKWDTLSTLFIGKGGNFKFASPGAGWTEDIRNVLKSLFLLMLDFTRVPEGVWGGAISSSRASLDAQLPPFHTYIEGRRVALEGEGSDDQLGVEAQGGLYELIDIWLRTKKLTDPRVVVGPVVIKWPELDTQSMDVLLKWVEYLHGVGVLDNETTLSLSGLVEEPAAIIEKAKKEREDEEAHSFENKLKEAQIDAENQPDTVPNDQGNGQQNDNSQAGGKITPPLNNNRENMPQEAVA